MYDNMAWSYISSYKSNSSTNIRHLWRSVKDDQVFLVMKEFDPGQSELFTFKFWIGTENVTQYWRTNIPYGMSQIDAEKKLTSIINFIKIYVK